LGCSFLATQRNTQYAGFVGLAIASPTYKTAATRKDIFSFPRAAWECRLHRAAVCLKVWRGAPLLQFPRGAWERAECLKIFGVVGVNYHINTPTRI
jgi:hypothetical protein